MKALSIMNSIWKIIAAFNPATSGHVLVRKYVKPTFVKNRPAPDVKVIADIKSDPEVRDFKLYSKSSIPGLFARYAPPGRLDPEAYVAAASVLPMRANNYVVEDLIDWSNVPEDPIFQLVFPQPGMLHESDLIKVQHGLASGLNRKEMRECVEDIRAKMNPHPAGQKELNVPMQSGERLEGMQHKYRETVLFFPSEAQYCHSFCTYCFRWAQFTAVGSSQQFQSSGTEQLVSYLQDHQDVSDVLFTGGDPMVMSAKQWRKYLVPLLNSNGLDHLATIRIGSKSLAYWPYRFTSHDDADEILRLFEAVVQSGRHLSLMAHFSHNQELSTPVVQDAIRRIRMTGATIRSQAPLINRVNADPKVWVEMWRSQVRQGIVPYYMFVERDTGAKEYFQVPLHKALDIYTTSIKAVSGIGRTVRGPSMSATPGKVHVVAISEISGEKVFILKFIQARNPDWFDRPFFAKYDTKACWLGDLKPAFGDEKFFWEDEMEEISRTPESSGPMFPLPEQLKYHNSVLLPDVYYTR